MREITRAVETIDRFEGSDSIASVWGIHAGEFRHKNDVKKNITIFKLQLLITPFFK